MLKKILLGILFVAFSIGLYAAYRYYAFKKEENRRASYYENLVDTASPTVSVLRDSILIDYQNEKRTIHIYVPPEYETDTSRHYPVIYMMDGESSFNDLENNSPEWEINEVINMAHENGGKSSIVIGINQAEDRDAEYTPFKNEDNPGAHGDQFTEWVASDLKIWVDSTFRTKPETESTTIGGISRSGMMTYYMLMSRPDIFGNALVQSPSMWVDYDRLMAMELSKDELNNKKVYICVGEKETDFMIQHAWDVYNKFKNYGFDESRLKIDIISKEGHWHLTWRKSFALAYPWLIN